MMTLWRDSFGCGNGHQRGGGGLPEYCVFPACENGNLDFEHPQKTFRTAWRSLVKAAAKSAGDAAAELAVASGLDAVAAAELRRRYSMGSGFMISGTRALPKWQRRA